MGNKRHKGLPLFRTRGLIHGCAQPQARILINRKVTHLGYYGSEEEVIRRWLSRCFVDDAMPTPTFPHSSRFH